MDCDAGRLLVVDDDQANRDLLFDLLTPHGYAVSLAEDGETALSLAGRQEFDLVLLDITMPGIDGFGVLSELRKSQGRSELPVIMVTGRDDRDLVVRALDGGANDYITKPADLPVILARLRTQLALKRAYDQIVALEHDRELRNGQLERANAELAKANQQMKGDLQSAAKVQRALLPSALPEIPGIKFSWAFRPCADLAGDSLNVFQLDDDHIGFYLLDVSGHGVRAALLSVTLSRLLTPLPDQPSLLMRRDRASGRLVPTGPAKIALALNRRFQLDLDTWQYFTLFYGLLNVKSHMLRYISCGQPGPLYVPRDGLPRDLHEPIFAIGWVPNPNYVERRLQLRPGDRLHLYSDGIGETMNADRELFGHQRVMQTVGQSRALPLKKSLEQVLAVAEAFSGRPFEDDVSALALEIEPLVERVASPRVAAPAAIEGAASVGV